MRIGRTVIDWHWHSFQRWLRVTFHLRKDCNYQVAWSGIYGIRIGRWFFGAVSSRDVPVARQREGEKP